MTRSEERGRPFLNIEIWTLYLVHINRTYLRFFSPCYTCETNLPSLTNTRGSCWPAQLPEVTAITTNILDKDIIPIVRLIGDYYEKEEVDNKMSWLYLPLYSISLRAYSCYFLHFRPYISLSLIIKFWYSHMAFTTELHLVVLVNTEW